MTPIVQILRQSLKEIFEHVVVQISGYVIEKQPIAEVVFVSDFEYIPRIVLSGTGRGEHEFVEWRTPAQAKTH